MRRRAVRSCSSSAAPRRVSGADPAAVDAVRRLIDAGARPRVAAGVVAELTGAGANELYRAAAERGLRLATTSSIRSSSCQVPSGARSLRRVTPTRRNPTFS